MKDLETTKLQDVDNASLKEQLNDYGWQAESERATWSEQVLYMLHTSKWTDCIFIVGTTNENNKAFHCHKILLAKSSPVFEQMLFGLMREKDEIEIKDINPSTFQNLLIYIYTGKIELKNEPSVCDLFIAADKYLMGELSSKCLEFLMTKLTPQFACRVYETAQIMNLPALAEKAWKVILERTDEVLLSPDFRDSSYDLVLKLVQHESLHIDSEAILINSCYHWAVCELSRQRLPENTENLRQILNEIFSYFRYFSLTVAEFTAGPLKNNLLTSDEKVEILSKINDGIFTPLNGFCIETDKRMIHKTSVPNFVFSNEVNNSYASTTNSQEGVFCSFNMQVDSDILVCGFRIATKIGNCFVTIQKENGECIHSGCYNTNLGTSGGKIEFEPPIFMKTNEKFRIMLSSEEGQCLLGTGKSKESKNMFTGLNLAKNEYSFVPLVRYLKS